VAAKWGCIDASQEGAVGTVLQVANYQRNDTITASATIPDDNTIPQISEGSQVLTLAITPKSATNKLLIRVVVHMGLYGSTFIIALFQDSTASAIAAQREYLASVTTSELPLVLEYYMTAGTTSSTTFTVRAGTPGGGNWSLNKRGDGTSFLGGSIYSSITITEIQA